MLDEYAMNEGSQVLRRQNLPLILELFHYIEKLVIDVWLVMKLDLDGIEIAESVSDIERTVNGGIALGVDG